MTAYHKHALIKATTEDSHAAFSNSGKEATMAQRIGIGIDTARYGHRVAFLDETKNPAGPSLTVMESRDGYEQLQRRLEQLHSKHPNASLHVHIDAAGKYATNLETFLHQVDLPLDVSVGQPKKNKDYQQVHFPKRKSDDTESQAMARFAVVECPNETFVVSPDFLMLREVVSRLHTQTKQTTRVVNQLHNLLSRTFPELASAVKDIACVSVLKLLAKYPSPNRIAAARLSSLERIPYLNSGVAKRIHEAATQTVGSLRGDFAETLVKELVQQVRDSQNAEKRLETLVEQAFDNLPDQAVKQILTIPGIGRRTAAILAAKIICIDRFASPEKLVGYFGFFPEESSSGVDKLGRPVVPGSKRMSAKGNDLVRGYLWMATKNAVMNNPAVRPLYARLRANGNRSDVSLGHCARKLLHLVFAIWKTNRPFDPNHYPWAGTETSSNEEPAPAKKAAGPKQEQVQAQKEVTAANTKVESNRGDVNRSASNRSVDYAFLRDQVSIERVLKHLGYWENLCGNGKEMRGSCPLHSEPGSKSRSFSVNPDKNVYHCFGNDCNRSGNVLDFWRTYHKLTLHQAALHLATTFNLQIKRTEKRSP
jgi:transposase